MPDPAYTLDLAGWSNITLRVADVWGTDPRFGSLLIDAGPSLTLSRERIVDVLTTLAEIVGDIACECQHCDGECEYDPIYRRGERKWLCASCEDGVCAPKDDGPLTVREQNPTLHLRKP